MSDSFELSVEVSQPYDFRRDGLREAERNVWVKNQWPLVYFLQNEQSRIAYVGESTNAIDRFKNHLQNPERRILTKVSIIGSDKFNKSATLDIEANLIQYISAEGTYILQNGNFGQVRHNYYQQYLYKDLFRAVWDKLKEKKFVTRSLEEIQNSELFKFSPYKSLNEDQYAAVIQVLDALINRKANHIFISGSAGTGKTIVATYLMKLLTTKVRAFSMEELNEEEQKEFNLINEFQNKYPKLKIGIIVAMTSLRQSLQNVFSRIPGLKASMVMGPSDVVASVDKFDLLIVDEAHRLRQFKNISFMGAFRKANLKLGFDDSGTELDWILAQSHNQILFYDEAQSIKPSDIPKKKFDSLISHRNTVRLELQSQMRVKGGTSYISFVDELLNLHRQSAERFEMGEYELLIFDNLQELYSKLTENERDYGLSRLIAGYAWPWISKNDKTKYDIELDGLKFQWNTTDDDWVNTPNAFKEVGCIHTTQGYDLNYAGIIFGTEITYDAIQEMIEIKNENYHDMYGKRGVSNSEELKAFIINIYKTLMYRGIRGTYIYACDPGLKAYFKNHIKTYQKKPPFRILLGKEIKPYVNCIPLVNIAVAAGDFSNPRLEDNVEMEWIEPPFQIAAKENYFVCQVIGESMNKVIPNGSYCLFRKYNGGSRNGKIVLIASHNISDLEFGPGYTVKQYKSLKQSNEDQWHHEKIILKPLSTNSEYNEIELHAEPNSYSTIGIFEKILINTNFDQLK